VGRANLVIIICLSKVSLKEEKEMRRKKEEGRVASENGEGGKGGKGREARMKKKKKIFFFNLPRLKFPPSNPTTPQLTFSFSSSLFLTSA
jgi:hypothetical protein